MRIILFLAAIVFLCSCTTVADEQFEINNDPVYEMEGTIDIPSSPEADDENNRIESALLERGNKIENCMITYYCTCEKCNGSNKGKTATGMYPLPGVTVGVDPSVIPLGSDVLIDFGDGEIQYYRAADTGVTGNHVDILVENHEEALNLGVTTATIWWIEQ